MSKKTDQIKNAVESSLKGHFTDFGIDEKTGILSKYVRSDRTWRFAGYPHIGDNYADQDVRVVIVGSDLGSDELSNQGPQGTYHRFESKKERLQQFNNCFAHMAGTYATVIYLLRDKFPDLFSVVYEKDSVASGINAYWAIKKLHGVSAEGLISSFAMTNLHLFVRVKNSSKSGGSSRIWINMNAEYEFFKDELIALKPTVVVFQELKSGNNLDREHMEDLKKALGGCAIIRLLHPSTRKKGGYRLDDDIVKKIKSVNLF